MRQLLGSLALSALVTAGCADSISPEATPQAASALALASVGSPATRDAMTDYLEYTTTLGGKVLGCVGEPVIVTFRYTTRLQRLTDGAGGFHGIFTLVDKGTTGVGASTGTLFLMQEGQSENIQQRIDGFPVSYTANFIRRFISRGSATNFRVHNLTHFTIDASGETTVDFSSSDATCH